MTRPSIRADRSAVARRPERPPPAGSDPIIGDRVRAAIRGGVVAAVIFGVAAPWLASGAAERVVVSAALAATLQAAALVWLHRDRAPRRAILLGELTCATVIALSIAGGVALGPRFTTPMIPVVVAMGTGSFIPWGTKHQLRVALIASAGVLLHLAWLAVPPSGYPPLVALLGIALSVPMAGMVARERASIRSLAEKRRLAAEREVLLMRREITQRRRAEEASRLRELNAHIEAERERGRRHLAQRMHDDLAQPLAALRLQSWDGRPASADASGHARTRELSGLVESVIAAARAMIAELRPSVLDDFGLGAAVSWQARAFEEQHGVTCGSDAVSEDVRCDEAGAVALFRSLQEILGALARDPELTRVDLSLRDSGDDAVLTVRASLRGAAAGIPSAAELDRIRERTLRLGGQVDYEAPEPGLVTVAARVRRAQAMPSPHDAAVRP